MLLSRAAPDAPGAAELAAELTRIGRGGHRGRLRRRRPGRRSPRLLAEIPPEYPLTAVVHAAGVAATTGCVDP